MFGRMAHSREGVRRPDLAEARIAISDSPQLRRAALERLHRTLLRDAYTLGASTNETDRRRRRAKLKREAAAFTAALDAYTKIVRFQARQDLRTGLRTRLHDVIINHLTVRPDDPLFKISDAIRHALRIVDGDVG